MLQRGDAVKSTITDRAGHCDNDESGGFVAVVWEGQNRAYVNRADALVRA